jgi:hypothetical protein
MSNTTTEEAEMRREAWDSDSNRPYIVGRYFSWQWKEVQRNANGSSARGNEPMTSRTGLACDDHRAKFILLRGRRRDGNLARLKEETESEEGEKKQRERKESWKKRKGPREKQTRKKEEKKRQCMRKWLLYILEALNKARRQGSVLFLQVCGGWSSPLFLLQQRFPLFLNSQVWYSDCFYQLSEV